MPSRSVILTVFRLKSVIKRFATIPCFFATMIDSEKKHQACAYYKVTMFRTLRHFTSFSSVSLMVTVNKQMAHRCQCLIESNALVLKRDVYTLPTP